MLCLLYYRSAVSCTSPWAVMWSPCPPPSTPAALRPAWPAPALRPAAGERAGRPGEARANRALSHRQIRLQHRGPGSQDRLGAARGADGRHLLSDWLPGVCLSPGEHPGGRHGAVRPAELPGGAAGRAGPSPERADDPAGGLRGGVRRKRRHLREYVTVVGAEGAN